MIYMLPVTLPRHPAFWILTWFLNLRNIHSSYCCLTRHSKALNKFNHKVNFVVLNFQTAQILFTHPLPSSFHYLPPPPCFLVSFNFRIGSQEGRALSLDASSQGRYYISSTKNTPLQREEQAPWRQLSYSPSLQGLLFPHINLRN